MMIATLQTLVLALGLQGTPTIGTPTIEWSVPPVFAQGAPYRASWTVRATEATPLEAWRLGPAAFERDGRPLGRRQRGAPIELPAGSVLTFELDLAPSLGDVSGDFQIGCAEAAGAPVRVTAFRQAGPDVDFMRVDTRELAEYRVILRTNRGSLLVDLWPDVAPNHVRNFLDLSQRGFYENTVFHRVSPSFMVQGGDGSQRIGDPTRWREGNRTRTIDAEFNNRRHQRGVLSAARVGGDINSASSQFFIMTADYPSLDGQYSAFGRLQPALDGYETLDAIANAPGATGRDGTVAPSEPQQILQALVVRSF